MTFIVHYWIQVFGKKQSLTPSDYHVALLLAMALACLTFAK